MSRLVKPRERPLPVYPVAGVVAGVAISVAGLVNNGRAAGITALLVGCAFAVLTITRPYWRHRP